MGRHDEAFIKVAIAQRVLDAALGNRVLAFAVAKRKPVSRVVTDTGLVEARVAARIARLARYRVARGEDKVYAEALARAGILGRDEAAAALGRQRDLYAAGRGFIRLSALLRTERQVSRAQERLAKQEVQRVVETRRRTA